MAVNTNSMDFLVFALLAEGEITRRMIELMEECEYAGIIQDDDADEGMNPAYILYSRNGNDFEDIECRPGKEGEDEGEDGDPGHHWTCPGEVMPMRLKPDNDAGIWLAEDAAHRMISYNRLMVMRGYMLKRAKEDDPGGFQAIADDVYNHYTHFIATCGENNDPLFPGHLENKAEATGENSWLG